MLFRKLPEFGDCEINENGSEVRYSKNGEIINILIKNFQVELKNVRRASKELYFVRDLVALAFNGIPLNTGKITYADGITNNNHYTNLNWELEKKDYNDVKFLQENNIVVKVIPKYPNYRITSDGHVINSKGWIMTENYENNGFGRVRLEKKTANKKTREKISIHILMGETFLTPEKGKKLIHLNGLKRDNRLENLKWVDENYSTPVCEDVRKFYIDIKEDKEIDDTENSDIEIDEGDFEGLFIPNEKGEDDTIVEDDENEAIKKQLYFNKSILPEPHPPIYEVFKIEQEEYDLEGSFIKNGKRWKVVKYKEDILKNFHISEDMDLYSVTKKEILDIPRTSNGEFHYRFSILNKLYRLDLKDVLAWTFLKTPKDAIISVHKTWNRNSTEWKYENQRNHYTNIKWLVKNDFRYIKGTNRNFRISNHGDIYSLKRGKYVLIKEIKAKNGLRKAELRNKSKAIHYHHILTGISFVKRPNKNYRYIIHKDGDISNNHYRNLVWINTLSGLHNDHIRYFEIPGYPEYAISETNIPYSIKKGIFKILKVARDFGGYLTIELINNSHRNFLSFHRVVASARNDDFDPNLLIDHTDHVRDNVTHTNLRSVTAKENAQNIIETYIRGKRVIQKDLKGNVIKIYNNAKEAARHLGDGYDSGYINKCARKNGKTENGKYTSGDFIWNYEINKTKYICKEGEIFKILYGTFQGIELHYDNYAISNYGTVINVGKGYAKSIKMEGYPRVKLHKNDVGKDFSMHNLVGLLFTSGRTEERNVINHLDEDITNFRFDNLQWVTPSENVKHSSYKYGIPVKKLDMMTHEVLDVYNSITEAALDCDNKEYTRKGISKSINNNNKQMYGFYWENIPEDEIDNYPTLEVNKRKLLYPKK